MRTRRAGALESRCDCPRQSLDYGFAARSTTPPTSQDDCPTKPEASATDYHRHCEDRKSTHPITTNSPAKRRGCQSISCRERPCAVPQHEPKHLTHSGEKVTYLLTVGDGVLDVPLFACGKKKSSCFRRSLCWHYLFSRSGQAIVTTSGTVRGTVPGVCAHVGYRKRTTFRSSFMLALPIFTARHQATIVGVSELNFCVRDGNRWTLTTINTNLRLAVNQSAPL